MHAPELLSPAGTYRHMRFAFAYGADAVYAGQPRYSLRVRNNDFGLDNLLRGIEHARSRGKRFYVASNIAPHNAKLRTYLDDMAPIVEASPDALIMSDPGLIMMVRERWPEQPIHLSVQANVVNHAAARFWQAQGYPGSSCHGSCPSRKSPRFAPSVRVSTSRPLFTGRCASPTQVAACCPVTSIVETPTRGPAPMPAAGSTRLTRPPRMTVATWYPPALSRRC